MKGGNQNLMMLLVVIVCMSEVTYSIVNRCHVHVINGFSTNETLQAHCKSKDDDLGVRHITAHAEFNWTFRTDFFSRTKFNCHMWWSGGQKYVKVFWVDDKFLDNECGGDNCRWMSKDDGVYLYSYQHKEFRLKYKWEPWKHHTIATSSSNSVSTATNIESPSPNKLLNLRANRKQMKSKMWN